LHLPFISQFLQLSPDTRKLFQEKDMQPILPDDFVVFLRHSQAGSDRPDSSESPVASFSGYADARKTQQAIRNSGTESVIRFLGETGGGD
jgi:hypothetical protein